MALLTIMSGISLNDVVVRVEPAGTIRLHSQCINSSTTARDDHVTLHVEEREVRKGLLLSKSLRRI